MKWFGKREEYTDGIDFIDGALDYITGTGERPEKYAIALEVRKLLSTIEVPGELLRKAAATKWRILYLRAATKANQEAIDLLLNIDINDQKYYAVLAYNEHLTEEQAKVLLTKCDDSPRGKATSKTLIRKFNLSAK